MIKTKIRLAQFKISNKENKRQYNHCCLQTNSRAFPTLNNNTLLWKDCLTNFSSMFHFPGKCKKTLGFWTFSEGTDRAYFTIVCTAHPPTFCRGSWAPNQIFKQGGGLTGPQLLEGGCWESGGWLFFRGGCNFHIKNKLNKLKSEIFNDKKSL